MNSARKISGRSRLLKLCCIAFLVLSGSAFPSTVSAVSDSELQAETARNIKNDDVSGEDLAIREVARKALGTAAGTVVVMDATNGRIYTVINQDWAIRNAFKPCSTIKIVTGIAGYNERLIAPDGNLVKGSYRLNLDAALAYSNNAYFQKVGAGLGSDKMIYYALQLGLGTPTGINADGESAGRLPYGNENPRIYSHADDFEVTPLQLAVLVSAITNGGNLLVPRIAKTRQELTGFRGYLRKKIGFDPNIYRRVIPGMIGATEYGTAKSIPSEFAVAGKTGSCISKGTWVGLFASAAPVYDPKYSVVVITRGNRARGRHSAAIAAKIYEALRPGYGRHSNRGLIAANPPRAKGTVQPRNSAGPESTDRNEENVRPEIKRTGSARQTGTGSDSKGQNKVKGKTTEELFPTIVIVKGKPEITRPRVIIDQ